MAFFDSLLGEPGKYKLNPTMPQQNLDALQKILGIGVKNIENPYQGFEPIKQAATSHFMQQLVPQLTERFAASGDNAPSSGTLQQSLSQGASSLAEKLASLQSDYGQRQQQLGLQQAQLGTGGYESIYEPGEQGLLSQILPLAMDALAAYFTGGASIPFSAGRIASQASQGGQSQIRQSMNPISSQQQPRFNPGAMQAQNLLGSQSGIQRLLGQSNVAGYPSSMQPSLSSILGV